MGTRQKTKSIDIMRGEKRPMKTKYSVKNRVELLQKAQHSKSRSTSRNTNTTTTTTSRVPFGNPKKSCFAATHNPRNSKITKKKSLIRQKGKQMMAAKDIKKTLKAIQMRQKQKYDKIFEVEPVPLKERVYNNPCEPHIISFEDSFCKVSAQKDKENYDTANRNILESPEFCKISSPSFGHNSEVMVKNLSTVKGMMISIKHGRKLDF